MSMNSFLQRMAESPSIVLNIPQYNGGELAGYEELPIVVSDDSYRYRKIMGEHSLNLKFSLPGYYEIPIGTYCEYQGLTYTLETPENITKNGERYYEYNLIMQSDQHKLTKFMLRNTIPGDTRLKFSYTARPQEFLQLLVDNLNERDSGWSYGDDYIEAFEKVVSFNHNTCAEALQMIAEVFETEWEVKGKTIHLRRVEYFNDNPLSLSYGKGNGFLPGLGRSEYSDIKPVERLFTQGGDRNIDSSQYRRTESTGQVGSRELLMPANTTIKYDGTHFDDESDFNPDSPDVREYVTDESGASVIRTTNAGRKGLIEGSLDLTSVYPMREGEVASVIPVDPDKNFYDFTDDDAGIPNYNDYQIAGETMTVIFQTGMLTGREFDVIYKPKGRFEIVPQTIDGLDMPNEQFSPRIGDRYAIFNVMLPDEYILEAEKSLLKQAVKYLYENEMPRFTFRGTLDAIWAKRDWVNIGGRLVLGGLIRFSDTQFLPEGMNIRITGIKDYINNPHKPDIELSNNSQSGSWLHSMQRQVASDEVTTEVGDRNVVQFAKRRFRDVRETMDMLENSLLDFTSGINPVAINTMMMLVGEEGLQFDYSEPVTTFRFDPEDKQFHANAGVITHKVLTDSQGVALAWDMPEYNSAVLDNPNVGYFVYAKVEKGGISGVFVLYETARPMNGDPDYYYLLVGILNSEFGGNRSFAQMYGFTEILPGRITTDRIVSADGNSYMDLANSSMRLGNEGYTQGMDFNETKAGELTIKGIINALGAILGGFKIDNDKFQSLKETDGQPNIVLDGRTGEGLFTGKYVSRNGGSSITIDPATNSIVMYNDSFAPVMQLIYDNNYAYIEIGDWVYSLQSRLSGERLEFNVGRPPSSWYSGKGLYLNGGLVALGWDDDGNFMGRISGLPTSTQGLPSGSLWRDGTTLRIVP